MIIDNYDKSGFQVNDLISKDRLGNHIEEISSLINSEYSEIYNINNFVHGRVTAKNFKNDVKEVLER